MTKSCGTCEYTHVKSEEFPCRDCWDQSRWVLADRCPWPMFKVSVAAWEKAKHEQNLMMENENATL